MRRITVITGVTGLTVTDYGDVTDTNGQVMQRREQDGLKTGDISNNGTSDVDYAASIAQHTTAPGTGPFLNGSASGYNYADFDQSYDPINGLNYQQTASRYTVREGDTLESIATQVWGDASLWYKLAEANGLTGSGIPGTQY